MVLWISLVLVWVGSSLPTHADVPPPVISFMASNEFHFGSNSGGANITRLGERRYVVPAGVQGSVLVCNATYPITWKFHNAHVSPPLRPLISFHYLTSTWGNVTGFLLFLFSSWATPHGCSQFGHGGRPQTFMT